MLSARQKNVLKAKTSNFGEYAEYLTHLPFIHFPEHALRV